MIPYHLAKVITSKEIFHLESLSLANEAERCDGKEGGGSGFKEGDCFRIQIIHSGGFLFLITAQLSGYSLRLNMNALSRSDAATDDDDDDDNEDDEAITRARSRTCLDRRAIADEDTEGSASINQ